MDVISSLSKHESSHERTGAIRDYMNGRKQVDGRGYIFFVLVMENVIFRRKVLQ